MRRFIPKVFKAMKNIATSFTVLNLKLSVRGILPGRVILSLLISIVILSRA